MKKHLFALPLIVIALTACNATQGAKHPTPKEKLVAVLNTKVLHFVGPMDLTLTLKSRDNFETAVMTDNADRSFQMHSVPAASGVRMSNGQGVTIIFKNGDGTVELVPGKPIPIQEVKK